MKLNIFYTCSLTLILLVSGCGGGSDGRVGASGIITIDGRPLEAGTIVFSDENGSSAGVGMIEDGNFTLAEAANSSGIQPGTYKVSIDSWISEPGDMDEDGNMSEGDSRIPEKYNDPKTSGLTATVSAESQEFTFELKSE